MHIVDADAHLVEGPELLATLLERFPEHVELRTDGAGEWGLHLEGRRYPQSVGPGAGVRPGDALCGHGIDPSTAAGVLADADREGIERMVLYPSLALAVPGLRDPALAVGFARAFNAHVAAWCRAGCGRLLGVAVVPLDWPEEAMTVLEDARARGLIAACLPPATHRYNLDHPDLDPLFALAAELDMPLGVHGAPGLHLPKIGVDRFERYVQVHCVSFPFDQMTAMTALVSGGVLERHPRLRVAFLEAGCGWVPWFLERLDEHFEKRRDGVPGGWARPPREYLERGQIYVTCEPGEAMLPAVLDHLGDGCVMYASDYPHWDSDFPASSRKIREHPGLDDRRRARVLGENACRFYGLEPMKDDDGEGR